MAKKNIKFELTAVNKTKAAFDSVTKNLKSVGSTAAGAGKAVAGVGLAAAGAAAAIGVLINQSFQFIDALGKTSTRTGITTAAIQAFQLAARESGTNIEGANKALEKFARSVGDAQRGLKTQLDIFRSLGVELQTNEGTFKSTDQLLEEVAVGISNLGSQTQKATALANLFGRQGILLTGALEDLGSRGLDNFIARAEALGIVLDEKVIRRTEKFNDAIGVLQLQFNAIKNNISVALLPVLENLQTKLAEVFIGIKESAGGFDALGVAIVNNVLEGIASMIVSFGEFRTFVQKAINNVATSFDIFVLKLLRASTLIIALTSASTIFMRAKKGLTDAVKELEKSLEAENKQAEKFTENAKKAAEKVLALKPELSDLEAGFKNSTQGLNDFNNELNRTTPINAYIDQLKEFDLALENVAVSSLKRFEDAIIDGLRNGKLAFKDFADFVVEQLLRIAIQQFLIRSIIDPFEKFLGGFSFLNNNPTSSPNQSNPSGDPSNFNPNMPFFAGGGFTGMGVRAGGVDGRGGFPAILHPRESVIDHTKGQGMGATVNFNISTIDATGFDELLATRKGLITSIINNAMNNRGRMGVA